MKENPEYSVPVKMMKPEARNKAIVVGNLSTEVSGVGAKSDRRRWVAWDAGPNEQSRGRSRRLRKLYERRGKGKEGESKG